MSKRILIVAILLAAALAGYWYYSPYVALHGMQSAAKARDADRFNSYVDYPALRKSLKAELTAKLTDTLSGVSSDSLKNASTFMGAMLGMTLVDKLIDTMVKPEFVIHAMNAGRLEDVESGGAGSGSGSESGKKQIDWSLERRSLDQVVAYARNTGGASERVGVVLERTGFADWKITGLRWAD